MSKDIKPGTIEEFTEACIRAFKRERPDMTPPDAVLCRFLLSYVIGQWFAEAAKAEDEVGTFRRIYLERREGAIAAVLAILDYLKAAASGGRALADFVGDLEEGSDG